jgi:hypothetical protein
VAERSRSPRPRGSAAAGGHTSGLQLAVPPALLDDLVERVAAVVVEQLRADVDTPGRWLRGAAAIAEYIDAPTSRVNRLSSVGRIPVEHDGSNLVAHTDALDEWIRGGGGVSP